jgi:uncharacterized protein YndB with AHSA1/START domain
MDPAAIQEKPSLRLTREYPVAPEKVWRAWTDSQALKRWWAPEPGDRVSHVQLDVRIGGRFRIVFGGPEGTAHEVQGTYREVVLNRKLAFTWTWPNSTPDRESLVTILFRAVASGTELVFTHKHFVNEAVRDNHRKGWSAALASLDQFFQGESER